MDDKLTNSQNQSKNCELSVNDALNYRCVLWNQSFALLFQLIHGERARVLAEFE